MSEFLNIEAEQALLGALMVNNEILDRVSGAIAADDFVDPVHQRIFENIASRVSKGHIATPVTLKVFFEDDEGLREIGGAAYLARLAGAAISLFAARDYANVIRALADKRRLAEALRQSIEDLGDPDRDAAAVLGGLEARAMALAPKSGAQVISLMKAVSGAVTAASDAFHGNGIPGTPSGLADLDGITGGFFPGDLVILAGRPSMGKTALALSMSLNAARAGNGVVIASLEMTAESLAMRAVSEATAAAGRGVPYSDARRGQIEDAALTAFRLGAESIAELPIQIIPPDIRDIGAIFAATRRAGKLLAANGTPLSMLVVDYLQLIRSAKPNRYEQISEISMGLKALAMQLNIPVVALSQLSRAVESRDDKRPIMSDLRESGQIEQDADAILFCYRDEYYLIRERPGDDASHQEMQDYQEALAACSGYMDIILAKQRMGQIGTVRVRFDDKCNRVTDSVVRWKF